MATENQIQANKENAKLGGVKTEEGKNTSKYNALKHGILKETVSDYERDFYDSIAGELEDQFKPVGIFEELLVDRIAIYYLKLYRSEKAENEFMRATLNPRKVVIKDDWEMPTFKKTVVENEGYQAIVSTEGVDSLTSVYLRYAITLENRLYKALHELQRVQAARFGEKPPLPVAVDVDISTDEELGSFGKNQF